MANNTNYIGVAMGLDVTDLKAGISEANKQIKLANSEFKAASSGMEDWTKSTEGLNAKIKQLDTVLSAQKSKLAGLKAEYEKVAREQGENSEAARNLKVQINNQQAIVNRTEREFENFKDTLKQVEEGSLDLEDATLKAGKAVKKSGDDAESAGDGFTVAKGAIAGFIANGLTALVGAAKDAATSLFNLAEETREFRQDMATLETAFSEASFSAETATDTWKGLYAVFGEDDRAVEAANNIARMAKNEQELNEWVTITTGVWGTYQDALPVEALAESAGETAKVGTVTGNLADALNWSSEAAAMFADYMGGDVVTAEDAFNVALSKCNTEAERQALITETLTTLYGGAAKEYEETAASVMDANKATADLTLTEAELAESLEPVNTALTTLKTELLTAVAPAVEKVSEILLDFINWAKENPKIVGAVSTAVIGLTTALGGIVVVFEKIPAAYKTLKTAFTTMMALFPQLSTGATGASGVLATIVKVMGSIPTPVTLAIAAITAAIAAIVSLWKNSEEFRTNIKNIWSDVKQSFNDFCSGIVDRLNALGFDFEDIVDVIRTLWQGLCDVLGTIWRGFTELLAPYFEAVLGNLALTFDTILNLILNVLDIFIGLFTGNWSQCWEGIKGVFITIWNYIYTWAKDIIFDTLFRMFEVVLGWFGTNWSEVWTSVKNFFVETWTAIKDFFVEIWNGIKDTAQSVADWFVSLWTSIKDTAISSWNGIVEVFSTIANWFNDNIIQPIWDFLYPFVHNAEVLITGTWQIIQVLFSKAAEWFNDNVIQPISEFFTELWTDIKNMASDAWNWIVGVFTVAATWYNKNVITPIVSLFAGLWLGVKNAASDAWLKIKEVFQVVSSWFDKNVVQPVSKFFTGMWSNLKKGASDAWSGIKSVFSKVSSWFKDTFADAWAKVKGVFSTGGKVFDGIKDGIVSAFKTVVNAIIRGLNKVVAVPFNAINSILGKIKNVEVAGISPFSGLISNISVPQIPELEWGGILKKGQVGLLEGKGKEAIIPLERHLGWIRNIARELAMYLASDTESIATGFASSYHSRGGHNATRGGTMIDARMTVNYNGNLSRKELKRLENDNYTAVKTRLKAEGAI